MQKEYNLTLLDGTKRTYYFEEIKSDEVIVVAIARNEGQYLEEWVKHYIGLGFDRIFIGDNNDDSDNSTSEILKKFIDAGKVVVLDCKFGLSPFQIDFYNLFTMDASYAWAFFCDIDEFLELNMFVNIKDFLNSEKQKDKKAIFFKWVNYGNNGIKKNDGRPVQERFKYPLPLNITDNFLFKTMLKGGNKVQYEIHGPLKANYTDIKVTYEDGYLKHYKWKSIEEQKTKVGQKLAYCSGPGNFVIRDFANNKIYHEDLIGKYCGLREESFFKGGQCVSKVLIFRYKDLPLEWVLSRIHPVAEVILKAMPMYENCYFVSEYPIYDDQFLALFEMALHTNNKICLEMPKIDGGLVEIVELDFMEYNRK